MQRSKKIIQIHDAFFSLCDTLPVEQITIQKICETAGIARNTFYSYYDNMDDLRCDLENAVTAPLLELLDQNPDLWGDEQALVKVFRYTQENEKKIHLLYFAKNSGLDKRMRVPVERHLHHYLQSHHIDFTEVQSFFIMSPFMHVVVSSTHWPRQSPEWIAKEVLTCVAKLLS